MFVADLGFLQADHIRLLGCNQLAQRVGILLAQRRAVLVSDMQPASKHHVPAGVQYVTEGTVQIGKQASSLAFFNKARRPATFQHNILVEGPSGGGARMLSSYLASAGMWARGMNSSSGHTLPCDTSITFSTLSSPTDLPPCCSIPPHQYGSNSHTNPPRPPASRTCGMRCGGGFAGAFRLCSRLGFIAASCFLLPSCCCRCCVHLIISSGLGLLALAVWCAWGPVFAGL
jgi:hypothetical protein